MKQKVDISIIYDCQKGNHDAFRQIYEAYQQQIYGLAFRYTNDSEESLDITQEIFMRIFLRIGNFRNECSFDTWVYRVSVNAIISAIRKNKDHTLFDEEIMEFSDSSAQADIQLESQETEHYIKCAIAKLPESLRMPFILVVQEQRTYADVADILEINISAVRMRVSRARQLLRTTLQPYINGDNI